MEAVLMKRKHMLGALALLGLCCWLVSVAPAAEDKRTEGDAQFVVAASAAGLAEINFGMLAEKRAANDDVRKFAHQMVVDHTKANKELGDIAGRGKYAGAAAMDRDHQAQFDKLSKMEGTAFDREYLNGQVKDHEDAIRLFEAESKNGNDEGLKAWASKALPTLREHQKTVRDLADRNKSGR
jgi:putative membrane protein